MKKLLQELKTFKLYGKQYLDKSLYKEYKEYLCEKILNELTAKGLANTFKYIFKNNVKNNSKATVDEINKFKKSILNVSYKTKLGEVVKDASTNLSINNAFCKKGNFHKRIQKGKF